KDNRRPCMRRHTLPCYHCLTPIPQSNLLYSLRSTLYCHFAILDSYRYATHMQHKPQSRRHLTSCHYSGLLHIHVCMYSQGAQWADRRAEGVHIEDEIKRGADSSMEVGSRR